MNHQKNEMCLLLMALLLFSSNLRSQALSTTMKEPHRPQVHFSPKANWINDPNGMVFYKGVYHLFFQHYPYKPVWGPMHWGHATSKDLVHWKEQPIALYPDSLGMIFSGSAVVDKYNTTGFGKKGQTPLVAIFTHHDDKTEKSRIDFQNQSLAYSLDAGKTWTKYAGNPVLKNPGIIDFRDPKVMWFESGRKWIMTLATKDCVTFYSSPDLKNWSRESEFGKTAGAHGGVWECPDLFPLNDRGKTVWVLLVNLNPGGPNKGSATQYFLGDFDGKNFTPFNTDTKWLDYGPDEYAGVTWSNTDNRKIFLGWMSNWLYANLVPTEAWRNATTIPRDLFIKHVGNQLQIASEPFKELALLEAPKTVLKSLLVNDTLDLTKKIGALKLPCRINMALAAINDFTIVLSNKLGENLQMGFDKKNNQYFLDRRQSGETNFHPDFANRHFAPRLATGAAMKCTLIIDESSIELFADDGLTVMTQVFFSHKSYNRIHLLSPNKLLVNQLEYIPLKPIWD